ncbi:acyltransferase family protein [Pseudomonas sp. NPDC089395]|uniref:acyltransferase family protein n=1 Tax=Pseudomonas sp. NPDC089395 TaxID=3364460 RepID=UPI0038244A59
MTSLAESINRAATKSHDSTKYRPDIDGLRAIAVLSVVGFHAFPAWVTGGFIGVDIFFVISGYLITTILLEGLARGRFSIPEFYSRRVNRIFPALITVMLVSYVFGWLMLFTDEFQQLGKHIAGGSAFISNLVLWNESGYFDTTAEIKPFLHLWSLGIEEQYYIFWPVIMWAAWKRNFNLLTVAMLLLGASFTLNLENVRENPTYTFYMPQTRCWELLIGSVLAYLSLYKIQSFGKAYNAVDHFLAAIIHRQAPAENGQTIRNIISFIGLGLIIFGLATITKTDQFPGWRAIFPTVGTALIIAAGSQSWLNRTILSNRILVWVGLISFPLYLWHWPLLTFARIIEGDIPARNIRITMVVLSFALAWITYKIIEKPIRGNRNRFTTTALTIAMIAVGALGFTTYKLGGLPDRPSINNMNKALSQFSGPLWKYATNELCLKKYPYEESKDFGWWFCSTNKDENPTLLLFGNSYVNHLYPGLAHNKDFDKNTVLSLGTCGVGSPDYSDKTILGGTDPCTGYRPDRQEAFIFDVVKKAGTVKYAIIDGLIKEPYGDYIKSVEKRVNYLLSQNIKVIIFIPHMTFDYDIKKCFVRPMSSGMIESCTTGIDKKEAINKSFKPLMDEILRLHPQVQFFDQNELFCKTGRCSMILEGMPIFRDQVFHYSEYASEKMSEEFATWAKVHAPEIFTP